jgi:hypothetical protein
MEFDLLVCAGVRAVKWWANQNPECDLTAIHALVQHLRKARSREVIVISTIDVYPEPVQVDERSTIHGKSNHPYGQHRLEFEDQMRSLFERVRVVRLPGLFGPGLKKNVIYDLMHDNQLDQIHPESCFQYYCLSDLWRHVTRVRTNDLDLVNLATEPIANRTLIARHFPMKQTGGGAGIASVYDVRTRYAQELAGNGDYVFSSAQIHDRLSAYLAGERVAVYGEAGRF